MYHVHLGVVPFFGNGNLFRKKLGPKKFTRGINLGTTPRRHHTRGSKSPGLKLHRSKRGVTITPRRFSLLSLSCNFSVPKYFMYSSRSFKLSCMDGQVDYPGVQGNVGQTLSCPSEKDCEPSHAKTCLLATEGCPEFADGAAFSNNSSLVSNL